MLLVAHGQILGYQPVSIVAGYNFLANPFNTGDNTLASVISPSSPPAGTAVYLWNVTTQQFAAPALYSTNGWSTNLSVPPGTGFVLSSPAAWTLTFIGLVPQGSYTSAYAGGSKFSLLASYYPASEALTGPDMLFPRLDSQNVFLYDPSRRDFADACTYYAGYGWFDPAGRFGTAGPVISIAQSFFAQNLGPDTNWVQTSTGFGAKSVGQSSSQARLQSARVSGGKVTLSILNPGGSAYHVEFSADGSLWTTLATNQTGTSWTGPVPEHPPGFYRLTKP